MSYREVKNGISMVCSPFVEPFGVHFFHGHDPREVKKASSWVIGNKIGNGVNNSYLEDKLHNEGVLKDVFPRLYALERHQNVTIHTKLIDYSLVNSFRRNPRSGVEEFQTAISPGEFSVKSIRQVIDANCFPDIHFVFPLWLRDGLNLCLLSWLGKYRLGGMWITLMFLLMRNGTLAGTQVGTQGASQSASQAGGTVVGSQAMLLLCLK
ncbi:hypothetical protein Tco_0546509 [Tanacetum coccineum]